MVSIASDKDKKRSKSYVSAVALVCVCILFLPIYKGGYRPLPTAVFFVACSLVFFLIREVLFFEAKKYWFMIWLFVSLTIFLEPGMALPISFRGGFIQSGLDLNLLYTWAYFTATAIIALTVSEMKLSELKWVFLAIMVSSLFQAVYGLYSIANDSSSILGMWEKEYYLESVTGTFINRNIYAGMLALSFPLVLMAILTKQVPGVSRWPFPWLLVLSASYSSVILIAALSSQSRMGLAAAVIGVCVFSLIYLRNLKTKNQLAAFVSAKYFPLAGMFLILLFFLWFGIGDIGNRYAGLENGDSRIEIWQSLFSLPLEVWVKGIGAGAFNDVFNQVRPMHYSVEMRYAHNDYLQFILQFGLVWSAILIITFIYFIFKCLPRGNWGLRSGALGTLTALAMHSLVDSNLQIPGSALIAWVAFGVLMNQNLVENKNVLEIDQSSQGLSEVQESQRAKRKKRSASSKAMRRNRLNTWLSYFRSD